MAINLEDQKIVIGSGSFSFEVTFVQVAKYLTFLFGVIVATYSIVHDYQMTRYRVVELTNSQQMVDARLISVQNEVYKQSGQLDVLIKKLP